MRVTIAGDIGSGKTTIAREIARHVGVDLCSTGGIQRQLAAARGITTLELNRLAETDGSIDEQIDNYLRTLPAGDLVVESRMAWRFVPDTSKIFLYVLKHAAARRILEANRDGESYRALADAALQIGERRRSEVKRFKKYYGVDIDDLRNYDRVIDTTFATPQAVVERILRPDSLHHAPGIWLNPKDLVPTRSMYKSDEREVVRLAPSMGAAGFDEARPIEVLYVGHTFFILHGHARAAAAIRARLAYVPLRLTACEDEAYLAEMTARRFVERTVAHAVISEWERAASFRYPYPIWKDAVRSSDSCAAR
jgi:CMP/dCMP kinase